MSLLIEYKNLLKEIHPTMNSHLNLSEITHGSEKSIYWICGKNHIWQSIVCNRTIHNSQCPYCQNKKTNKENCLATKRPDLLLFWDYEKNSISPFDIVPGSDKRVWWKCNKNKEHVWKNSIYSKGLYGCPYCSGQKVCKSNFLNSINPDLAKEWNYEKNILTPDDYTANSGKRVWWICQKKHVWQAPIARRNSGHGCPYCTSNKTCIENSLKSTKSPILEEWDYSLNSILPEQISPCSHKKVWWRCKKNHSWQAVIKNRFLNKTNCPKCCCKSKGEAKIIEYLEKNKLKFIFQFSFEDCKNSRTLPFDFYVLIKDNIFLIEYNGIQHYKLITFVIKIQKKNLLDYKKMTK